jgi:DNA-binding NarL/FixJ family response regulator
MVFISSKVEFIQRYWKTVFSKKFDIENIDVDSIGFDEQLSNNDILVLDLDQFDSLEEIFDTFNKLPKYVKVIALLEEPKLAHGAFMIKKGFKSYLGKKTSNLILEQVISTVESGNVWLYPELMNYIIKHIEVNVTENKSLEVLNKLSIKEQEVAKKVAQGLSNKEIAESLDVQLVTVKKHIGSIFNKLNIKDRVSLAILVNK